MKSEDRKTVNITVFPRLEKINFSQDTTLTDPKELTNPICVHKVDYKNKSLKLIQSIYSGMHFVVYSILEQ